MVAAEINRRGVDIPFTQMGAVSSDDLFEAREQPIFDFYERNRGRYQRALDIGANLGIHTILMARQGWAVKAFEPDPEHFARLQENLQRNGVQAELHCAAVSDRHGKGRFVRVLGNTTANHLEGAREHHGAIAELEVALADCRSLFDWADLAKIDVEGHEAALLLTVRAEQKCAFMVEVGSADNAAAIFGHCRGALGRRLSRWCFGAWKPVIRPEDMPKHYTEGNLFIGSEYL